MKKITKIAACGLLAALSTTALVSCADNSLAKEVLSKVILTQEGDKVSADFTVPKIVNHNGSAYEVSWTSSDTSVLDIVENNASTYTADVKRPFDADKDITLTASVTVDGKNAKNTFKTTVTYINAEDALSTAISKTGIKASYNEKTELELPASSNEYRDEITFDYSLGGNYVSTTLDGKKLTMDPDLAGKSGEKVIVKVKATSGSNVVEKEVKTTVTNQTVYLSVTDALAQPVDAMIYVQGRIKSIVSATYGNFWIVDEAGKEIEIYGLYQGDAEACYDKDNNWIKTDSPAVRYDKWKDEEKLAEGDYVYVYGKRAVYGSTQEISNCLIQAYPFLTVSEAVEVAKGEFISFYGEIKNIASDKYGNMYLKDAAGKELYLYGLYSGTIEECYDENNTWLKKGTSYGDWKAEDKLAAGDVIAVYGPMDEYNGSQQIKNALLTVVLKKHAEAQKPAAPTYPEGTVGLDVFSLELGNYAAGEKVVSGTTFKFTEIGSYGNGIQMRIKGDNTASLWNTTAFTKKIAKIVLTSNEKNTRAAENVLSIKFGAAADALNTEVKLSTTKDPKEYTITPEGDFTFFSITLTEAHTYYWDSIV
ncbi:MAG: hypothetical protein K2H06_00380, partial [Anaeroplasmataceae bacterium]|nr:hypothetical protein [Anaeroplasmataceae bacterium]